MSSYWRIIQKEVYFVSYRPLTLYAKHKGLYVFWNSAFSRAYKGEVCVWHVHSPPGELTVKSLKVRGETNDCTLTGVRTE